MKEFDKSSHGKHHFRIEFRTSVATLEVLMNGLSNPTKKGSGVSHRIRECADERPPQ